jgi:hypothetical protein
VNQQHGIHPDVGTVDQHAVLSFEKKCEVGDVLYADLDLIDGFVSKNPGDFSDDQREIVESWKNAVEGRFFIERLLKRYAVFIGDSKAYGGLGITDPIEDILAPVKPPVYVQTALLPFKGRIRETIKLAQAAVADPKDLQTLHARLKRARSALSRTRTVLARTEV